MNKITFIHNILKKYGNYTKEEIQDSWSNTNTKQSIEQLAILQKKYGLQKNLYSTESNERRAYKIYTLVKNYIPKNIDSFVDFGGGSCDISYYFGSHIKAKNVYCVDIDEWVGKKWKRNNKVTFMKDMKSLPDKSIQCILTSHTLHHIPDTEIHTIIQEFYRILSDDGYIILQEHNSPNTKCNELLYIQHMLYDTVVSQTIDFDTYQKEFYSNYKSLDTWNTFFSNFYGIKYIPTKAYDNTYIAIYQKIGNLYSNKNNINKSKLQISEQGSYSVTHKGDAKKTADIIESYFGKDITITDGTANNGGNTIAFGLQFKKVQAVEISKKEYDILVNNINVYKLKNIETYHKDFIEMIPKLKQDVVFLDPPWGGPSYKTKRNIPLSLGKYPLVKVIDMLQGKCKAVVCKVPFNYDFFSLFKYGRFSKKIHLYIFQKYVVFVILERTDDNKNIENYKKVVIS